MTKSSRTLRLRTETLIPLTHDDLRAVAGAFIMKDSVIVRTSGRIASGDPADGVQAP